MKTRQLTLMAGVLASVLSAGFTSIPCGGGDESVNRPSSGVAEPRVRPDTEPASADDLACFQQLNAKKLQLMIEVAQKEYGCRSISDAY